MEIKVSTKNDKGETIGPVVVNVDVPETLPDLVKKYGEGPIADAAVKSIVIGIQNVVRRGMLPATDKTGKEIRGALSQKELQDLASNYTMDTRATVRLSAFEKAAKALDAMSPEDRKALLARIQEMNKPQHPKAA